MAESVAAKQESENLAGIKARGQCESLAEAECHAAGSAVPVLLLDDGPIDEAWIRAEQCVPIGLVNNLLQIVRILADGVEAADQSAHAGAGDEIDGDVMLFKILDDADVRQAERAAAAEREANAAPHRCGGIAFLCGTEC